MKVVHVCLCSYPYISSWGYQENYLVRAHHRAGHNVTVITTAYIPPYLKEHVKVDDELNRREYIDCDGTKIIRLPYKYKWLTPLQYRVKIFESFYSVLEKESPDVLFIHDLQFWDLFNVKKYAENHPECLMKADIHASEVNSANNLASKILLHRFFFRWVLRKNYKLFNTIYYISDGCKEFIKKYYGITDRDVHMEELLLGGEVFSDKERNLRREYTRKELGLKDDEIMLLHSGKLEVGKRTHELLMAFFKVKKYNAKLFIVGSIPKSQEIQLKYDMENDNRVVFLGWRSAEKLRDYLCAADLYLQPGTQSSTLQTAMCCGCPCVLNFDRETQGGGYSHILTNDQAFEIKSTEDITEALLLLCRDKTLRDYYANNAKIVALKKFDYDEQIKRIIQKWQND